MQPQQCAFHAAKETNILGGGFMFCFLCLLFITCKEAVINIKTYLKKLWRQDGGARHLAAAGQYPQCFLSTGTKTVCKLRSRSQRYDTL
jgi:hypothetical protein